MNLRFEKLFTVSIEHEYYNGRCNDFHYVIPSSSQTLSKRGRLLFKERNGSLYTLYEADSGGTALSLLSNTQLAIGMALRNPYFANFSDHSFDGTVQLYRNSISGTALDAPISINLCGDYLRQILNDTDRPVTVSLKNIDDVVIENKTLSAEQSQDDIEFDMRSLPNGLYTLEETYPGGTTITRHYHHPELLKQGVFAIVDIAIDATLYGTEAEYLLSYLAREDTIKYYVVADNYSESEFNSLTISDTGFTEDGRSQVNFTRFLPAAFTADDIDESVLHDGSKKLAVFKSTNAQKRINKPRSKIQLNKNGDVLIPNLPSPRADKHRPEFVIHVEKP